MLAEYTTLDIFVFATYLVVILLSGYWFNRKSLDTHDYFLANNTMPMWVVAISVLATSQSAATFLGGPDQGYRGDLTYLATNIGAIFGALIVAFVLIPRFYQLRVFTVYQLLQQRFGEKAKQQAGLVYLLGRLLASGARLYMAAIAVAMILFGDIETNSVFTAIAVITITGLLYTVYGGIRTVIYSDAIQCFVYVSAAIGVLFWLLWSFSMSPSEIYQALENPIDGGDSKLTLLNWELDFSASGVFNMWSVLTGFVLLNVAAFGLDQDMTQRVLTCKNARQGSMAMITSSLIVIPVGAIFIGIGLLLYVFYQRPDLIQSQSEAGVTPTFAGETVTVFMYYVLTEIPAGLKAWVTIGIIAAALSTLNSGLNSMASVVVKDFIQPRILNKQNCDDSIALVQVGRWAMVVVALLLCSVACLCFYWQQYTDMPLLQFALSVMVFSYSGLLGVYITALFTNRGSPKSIMFALLIGFATPVVLQPYILALWQEPNQVWSIGFTWQLLIGASLATCVCMMGKHKKTSS